MLLFFCTPAMASCVLGGHSAKSIESSDRSMEVFIFVLSARVRVLLCSYILKSKRLKIFLSFYSSKYNG